ncbi:acyl-CoA dehydrogenase family protein [uncultured Nocardioides sp.]|uniref:acyl-CoA dehydrogenase family protein n=1 Tax=uncultured Nocardioides sp. TaxID=198441 RepID=UPI00263A2A08|nr:acyl-CoA dehydrogenase family protein [uncultured Nocardioides sp.]
MHAPSEVSGEGSARLSPRVASRTAPNQPPPLVGHDVVSGDAALVDAVRRHARGSADDLLADLGPLGRLAGSEQAREHGRLANEHPPTLRTVDRYGNRVDEVEFHPSWHWLMERGVGFGLGGTPWAAAPDAPDAHLRRAAGFLAWSQVEPGHACPLSMTYAAVPALRATPALAATWEPALTSTSYDPGLRPVGEKLGALAGMGMTEKQGGSDVRATTTTATPAGEHHVLDGHKWFTSAPMNDVFLVLAQAPGGLSCFVVPRVLPDGTRNPLEVVRLKDKLGNRSNASAELELDGTHGWLLGEEGRGVRTILAMVSATRLDCVLGSAALVRRSVAEASWHVAHRSAFGRRLADAPLMRNVVADLAVESEAATALALRLATAVDRDDPLLRIGLPLAKFWVCKRTPAVVAEALECLGGNGYVEESGMPLLFRESPLNSVWEGSGNVNALDVLRALGREPAALDAWVDEVGRARGADARLDRAVDDVLGLLGELLADPVGAEGLARRLAGRMAACLQGALLVTGGQEEVADVFCASRLAPTTDGTFGALTSGDHAAIVERTTPVVA